MNLSNQKILIVGGGSGMGLALARRCVEAGATVIIAGRGEQRLQQACETLGNPAGLEIAVVDIARKDQVAALFAEAAEIFKADQENPVRYMQGS